MKIPFYIVVSVAPFLPGCAEEMAPPEPVKSRERVRRTSGNRLLSESSQPGIPEYPQQCSAGHRRQRDYSRRYVFAGRRGMRQHQRHRIGHRARQPGEDLRVGVYHQRRRHRNRAGTGDLSTDHGRSQRSHRRGKQGRGRHYLHGCSAGGIAGNRLARTGTCTEFQELGVMAFTAGC